MIDQWSSYNTLRGTARKNFVCAIDENFKSGGECANRRHVKQYFIWFDFFAQNNKKITSYDNKELGRNGIAKLSLPLTLSFALTYIYIYIYIRCTLSFSHSRSLYSLYEMQEREIAARKKLFYLSSPTCAFVCVNVYVCVYLHVYMCAKYMEDANVWLQGDSPTH